MNKIAFLIIALFSLALGGASAASPEQASRLTMVVVMSRHGVRSPSHPLELQAYAAQSWPSWSGLHGGYLTAHGAQLMRQYGAFYRRVYGPQLGLGASGCPRAGAVFIWADVDERTKATGSAVSQGFAPGCNVTVGHGPSDPDTLFDPLPSLGTVNKAESNAAVLGSVGGSFNGITQAYGSGFAAMENVLGCTSSTKCKPLTSVATYITNDGDGGLASLNGGLDMAGDVAENMLLEYTNGQSNVGWGRVNHATLIQLLQFEVLGQQLEHNRFAARAHSSNILTHILQTLQQGATGQAVAGTRVPPQAKFVFLSGHDTQLAEFRSMLGLSWLVKGDHRDNTPPGSALIFELHQPAGGGEPFVRTFYTAQSLDAMRAGEGQDPMRVPVYVPGCPGFDCPMGTFSKVVAAATDSRFVTNW